MQKLEPSEATTYSSLIDEAVFRETLVRERKRSERSGRSMILLLVGLEDGNLERWATNLERVVNAMSAIKTDIDRLGWFEAERTVCLIVPEVVPVNSTDICDRLEAEFNSALSRKCVEDPPHGLVLELRVHPKQGQADDDLTALIDPFFYPELSMNRKEKASFHNLKRGMDIVLSCLLLVLLSPLFFIVAALVKVSSQGPVFFRQVRVGHLMKPFTMYKFRTMHETADHRVHHDYVRWFITCSDKCQDQGSAPIFKLTGDNRITRIGWVLRRTSLDEIPQLWNVLKGDMSLVGPRPALPYEVRQYQPWHRSRVLEVKPGITGLWQVVGRSRTTFDEMIRLDLQYAETKSLWLDIKILLATPAAVIAGKGAC